MLIITEWLFDKLYAGQVAHTDDSFLSSLLLQVWW